MAARAEMAAETEGWVGWEAKDSVADSAGSAAEALAAGSAAMVAAGWAAEALAGRLLTSPKTARTV